MVTDRDKDATNKEAEELLKELFILDLPGLNYTKKLRAVKTKLAAVRKERDAELGKEKAGFYLLGANVERENQEDEVAEFEAEIKEWRAAARKAVAGADKARSILNRQRDDLNALIDLIEEEK